MSNTSDNGRSITVGGMAITAVWDGTLDATLETIRGLDRAEARRLIAVAQRDTGADPLVLPVRGFLIRSGGHLALVDTGSGTSKGASMGLLPASLAALGVAPAAIDSVILTHLHMDHIGGLIDDAGTAAFPNAELVVHHREAEYFIDTPRERLDARSVRSIDFVRKAVAAYGARVRRVADGEGLAGIAARLAPGHTPGHTAWRITSKGETAVILGDVVHLAAIQLPLPLTPMIYDIDPDVAGRTRIALLDDIVQHSMMVAGAHLPSPGLGRIVRAGAGYAFEPSTG